MKYSNEDEVKKALDIDSWRKLSREKVVKFAAMMPDMDKEVMLAIVGQLPVFTKFAIDALGTVQRAHEASLSANKHSQDQSHEAYSDVRDVLKGQLEAENLSPEERRRLVDALIDTAEKESVKDSENKNFVRDLFKYTVVGAGVLVLAGVVFVGGQMALQGGEDSAADDS